MEAVSAAADDDDSEEDEEGVLPRTDDDSLASDSVPDDVRLSITVAAGFVQAERRKEGV